MSLNNLANRLADLGHRKDALQPAQQAADTYRDLARANPDAYLPDLAMSLNSLTLWLADLGRNKDATGVLARLVEIRNRLEGPKSGS